MKKILLASIFSFTALTAMGQTYQPVYVQEQRPSVYQKQTVVRYNVPTCENCKTTTTVTRTGAKVEQPACATCNTCPTCAAPVVAPVKREKSCVYNNHEYAIGNPLFVLKQGQISTEAVGGYFVNPKGARKGPGGAPSGRYQQWDAAGRIMYGLTDWLSVKAQGGYWAGRYNTKQWKSQETVRVPHESSYSGTVGLEAHALDFCNLDLLVGVEGTWGESRYKDENCDLKDDFATITPYATLGLQVTPYVTPYIQAGYSFLLHPSHSYNAAKDRNEDDRYILQPGLYIQPSKYWAIHPYIVKERYEKPEWNLGLDFYPYKNLVFGVEGSAVSWTHNPMDMFGISGHLKMVF